MDEQFIKINLQEKIPESVEVDGCCVSEVLQWCINQVLVENSKATRRENVLILKKIQEAIDWVKTRNQNIELGR